MFKDKKAREKIRELYNILEGSGLIKKKDKMNPSYNDSPYYGFSAEKHCDGLNEEIFKNKSKLLRKIKNMNEKIDLILDEIGKEIKQIQSHKKLVDKEE